VAEALRLIDEDKRLCDAIASAGSALVKPGSRLLTHCNTGGLATAGVGTALGVIARAHQEGNVSNVWVDETRPLLQGGRLTAWELGELGVPYQLITDSMAASLMAKGQVDAVWVGADRIAANGDVANKIGTYSWRCWRNSTAFRSTWPRRKRPSTRTARTGTRSRLSSAPPAR
jgi:methylthioribose-1-phosphate isomerase